MILEVFVDQPAALLEREIFTNLIEKPREPIESDGLTQTSVLVIGEHKLWRGQVIDDKSLTAERIAHDPGLFEGQIDAHFGQRSRVGRMPEPVDGRVSQNEQGRVSVFQKNSPRRFKHVRRLSRLSARFGLTAQLRVGIGERDGDYHQRQYEKVEQGFRIFFDEGAQSRRVWRLLRRLRDFLWRRATDKIGGVTSMRDLQDDLIILPFSLVVGFEPLTQPVRPDSHDWIEGGIITLIPIIKLASDHILIQFGRAPVEVGFAD